MTNQRQFDARLAIEDTSDKLRGPALPAEELRLELTRMFLGYLRSKSLSS